MRYMPGPYITAMIDGNPVKPGELGTAWVTIGADLSTARDFTPYEGMTAEEKESEGTHDNKGGSSTETAEKHI